MDAVDEKLIKECLNEAKQSTSNQNDLGNEKKSLQEIQEIFAKTEAMKSVAKEKNEELENQFKDLRRKLNSSSEYLQRIKKNIENIKFSYQKNVIESQKKFDPATAAANSKFESRDDLTQYMEDIRRKIDDLHNKMMVQKEKQQRVTESYEEAFDGIVESLQQIESGSYSSNNLLG
ncbi:uncharacterized protein LOC130901103 [Diorhabda carinulata]|uniref:uncharacterized protein LOC130901103 n=1 Tax=Diorhabda carinulata TaxID=1163345 RepID=UPI0025A306C6|nr:uncharacterized protein LOC130901103 [Diorhabda carinulata]